MLESAGTGLFASVGAGILSISDDDIRLKVLGCALIAASIVPFSNWVSASYDKATYSLTGPKMKEIWDDCKIYVTSGGIVGPAASTGLGVATFFTHSPVLGAATILSSLATLGLYKKLKNTLSSYSSMGEPLSPSPLKKPSLCAQELLGQF